MYKTAVLRDKLDKFLLNELNRQKIKVVNYDPNTLTVNDAKMWNESIMLNQFLKEYYIYDKFGILPLTDVTSIYTHRNTPYLLATSEISEQAFIDIRSQFYQAITLPFTPFYVMRLINPPSKNNYNATVINLKTMKTVYNKSHKNVFREQEIHKMIKINRTCKDIKKL